MTSRVKIVREYQQQQQLKPPAADSSSSSNSRRRSSSSGGSRQQQQQHQPPRAAAQKQQQQQQQQQSESFEDRVSKQLQTGELFEDPDFPTTAASLFPQKANQSGRFVWKRPKQICRDAEFFTEGVSRFDVKQGELGDCWLLAAISSLSMHRRLFEAVVPPGQEFASSNYCGMFRFRFWRFGEWKEVVVDDRLPTKKGKLCFMQSADKNEFWSALLEKAYAKVSGCYAALIGGSQAEAMEDFTGGLCETFDLTKSPPANLFDIMQQANSAQSLIGCSIESEVIEGEQLNGLITGHAYSVTDVRTVPLSAGGDVTLVRVRNPWGNECEWNGDWSDASDKWDLVSRGEKNRLKLDVGDDGEFWMQYSDFSKEFTKLEICHLTPETMSAGLDPEVAKKRRWELCVETGAWKKCISAGGCRNFIATFHTNPQFRVEVVDPDEDDDEDMGTMIVGLMQMDMRRLTQGLDFHTIGYSIYSISDQDEGLLDQKFFKTHRQADKSMFVNQREVTGRHKLPPGHYAIVPTTYEPNQEASFILRMFSERPNNSKILDAGNSEVDVAAQVFGDKKRQIENEGPLRKAFMSFAGPDAKIHAKQLQQILNKSFAKELKKFQGFSLEACRSMLALVDANMSGFMEFDEFKQLWTEVRVMKSAFKEFDRDFNGSFDATELREALKASGYNLCNKVFEAVAMRYMDPETGVVCFEDFILLAVRLKIAFDTFRVMDKDAESKKALVGQHHFLLQMLYF